jgi:hypothetical protein
MHLENVRDKIGTTESVEISVHTSVWKSVYASARNSVWNLRNSVWKSVNTGLQDPISQERAGK